MAKREAKTEPSAMNRRRPWLQEKQVTKLPEERYHSALRRSLINMPLAILGVIPVALGIFDVPGGTIGRIVAMVLVLPSFIHRLHQFNQLKSHPEIFFERDRKLRVLVADYQAQVAAGTWDGPPARPRSVLAAPIVAFVVFQIPLVVLKMNAFVSIAIGVVAGGLWAIGATILGKIRTPALAG